jgi:uncharacterized membrane protein
MTTSTEPSSGPSSEPSTEPSTDPGTHTDPKPGHAHTVTGRIPLHPAYVKVAEKRAADVQLRVADAITKFAGSMMFVYVHIVIFAVWMVFIESNPWPKLTLIVSLEAIFLSTFVMIGQNRQASFQQAKADHDFVEQELELKSNTQITREIKTLTDELHHRICVEDEKV